MPFKLRAGARAQTEHDDQHAAAASDEDVYLPLRQRQRRQRQFSADDLRCYRLALGDGSQPSGGRQNSR